MQPILIWPVPAPPDVVRVLDMAGLPWTAVEDEDGARSGVWAGAIIAADEDPERGFAMARCVRREVGVAPLLLLVRGNQLASLDGRHDTFDDFCVMPFHPAELEARVRHLLAAEPEVDRPGQRSDGLDAAIRAEGDLDARLEAAVHPRQIRFDYLPRVHRPSTSAPTAS